MERDPAIPLEHILAAIRGIGNILRHEYHSIQDEVIWDVVTIHLPELKRVAEAMLAALPSDEG